MVFSSSPYHEASKILSDIIVNHKGLKSLVYSSKTKKEKENTVKESTSAGSTSSGSGTLKCSKSSYALTCQTLQYKDIIDEILERNGGELYDKIQMKHCHNIGLAYILLYELLFGKYQTIRGGGSLKRTIMLHEEALRTAAAAIVDGTTTMPSLLRPTYKASTQFPKYVRVNTIKFHGLNSTHSATEIVAQNLSQYIRQTKSNTVDSPTTNNNNNSINSMIYADAHVPDLLVLSPNLDATILHTHPYVSEGKIIIQDKSSCFPAMCLIHGLAEELQQNSSCSNTTTTSFTAIDIIDACAAPGNKTTHIAALLLQNQLHHQLTHNVTFQIFALDRDSKRIDILKTRCELLASYPTLTNTPTSKNNTSTKNKKGEARTGQQKHIKNQNNVTILPTHLDFLKTNHNDPKFVNVRAILLDPSCSGSGIVNQPDRIQHKQHQGNISDSSNTNENQTTKQRLISLQNFQIMALKHAMGFPQVDRIVYSTCSIHEEENEIVVGKALRESATNKSNQSGWKICNPTCLDTWNRRGKTIPNLISQEEAQCMIRCDGLDGDETNGFFVCVLERQRPTSSETTKASKISDTKVTDVKKSTYPTVSSSLPIYNSQFRTTQPSENDDGNAIRSPTTNNAAVEAATHELANVSNSNWNSSKKRKVSSSTNNVNQKSISTPMEQNNSKKRPNKGSKIVQPDVVDHSTTKVNVSVTESSFQKKNKQENLTSSNTKVSKTSKDSGSTSNAANSSHEAKKEKKRKWKLRQRELKQNRLLEKKNKEGTMKSL